MPPILYRVLLYIYAIYVIYISGNTHLIITIIIHRRLFPVTPVPLNEIPVLCIVIALAMADMWALWVHAPNTSVISILVAIAVFLVVEPATVGDEHPLRYLSKGHHAEG